MKIVAGRVVRAAPNRDTINSPPQFDLVQLKVRIGQRIDDRRFAYAYFVVRRARAPAMGSSVVITSDSREAWPVIERSTSP